MIITANPDGSITSDETPSYILAAKQLTGFNFMHVDLLKALADQGICASLANMNRVRQTTEDMNWSNYNA